MGIEAVWEKLKGTVSDLFGIGTGTDYVNLKKVSGTLEVRNADDNAYARLKVGAPVDDQDAVSKFYADALSKPIIVDRQADTSVSLPNNTAVRGFVVVTTAGSGAAIGDILYDDGSNSGTMQILAAIEGRTIAVTDTLSGGTISFEADSIYIWDDDGTAWVKIGDIGNVTGAIRMIRFAINNSTPQDSTFLIPANSRVVEVRLEVTTQFSGGTGIEIGHDADADAYMTTADNKPTKVDTYVAVIDAASPGSDKAVRVTISGGPAAGAGFVIVKFGSPLA